jgi:hypothetical protein
MMSRNKRKAAEQSEDTTAAATVAAAATVTAAATATATIPEAGSRRTRSRRGKVEEGDNADASADEGKSAAPTSESVVAADGDVKEVEDTATPPPAGPADADADAAPEAGEAKVEEEKVDEKGVEAAAVAAEDTKDGPMKEEGEGGEEKAAEDAAEPEVESAPAVPKATDVGAAGTPKPSTPAEAAYWNHMFFQLMVRGRTGDLRGSRSPPGVMFCPSNICLFVPQLYRVNQGNVNVKSTDEKHRELYKWIVQLRKDYKVSSITRTIR